MRKVWCECGKKQIFECPKILENTNSKFLAHNMENSISMDSNIFMQNFIDNIIGKFMYFMSDIYILECVISL